MRCLGKQYANAPYTALWKQGAAVKGNPTLLKGTAIATFVKGKYPNHGHNNHAAIYISQDLAGIWVMDQWPHDEHYKPTVSKRHIRSKGKLADDKYIDPSNNADTFSIIHCYLRDTVKK